MKDFNWRLYLTLYAISCYQEILCDTNGSMAVTLQGKSMFSLVGQCAVYPSDNDQLFRSGVGDSDQRKYYTCGTACELNREGMLRKRNRTNLMA